jgi:hypothetical protein
VAQQSWYMKGKSLYLKWVSYFSIIKKKRCFVSMGFNKVLYYVLGTLILCLGALYNTYPFINGDTSVYITSGIENYVPYERPIFYGYFLKITSLTQSLWLTALAQAFGCSIGSSSYSIRVPLELLSYF